VWDDLWVGVRARTSACMRVCVCVCFGDVCVCECVSVYVCVCECVSVYVCVYVGV